MWFQRLVPTHTFRAADRLELQAIDGDPIALHQCYRARQSHQLSSHSGYASSAHTPGLGNRPAVRC
jgi:hypothetical protein